MMQSKTKLPILIVGASGNLGSAMTMEFLKNPDMQVNIFIRDTDNCVMTCTMVTKAGGKVFKGDVTKPDTIKGITKGMHTLISCLNGDDEVMIEGQKRLLEDGMANGLKRFVPSDFSMNIWDIPLGNYDFVDQRLKFRKILEKTQVKGLHFSMGMMMETFFYFVKKYGFTYWGDMDQKLDLTAMKDLVKYVMMAVMDKDMSGDVMVVGSQMSMKEIVDTYNMVMNKNETMKKMGTVNDLKMQIKDMKEKEMMSMVMQREFEVVFFDGTGKIKYTSNAMFPDVEITTMEMFIKDMTMKPMTYEHSMGSMGKKYGMGMSKEVMGK